MLFVSFSCAKKKKQEALEAERILREQEEQEAKEKVSFFYVFIFSF